MLLQHDAERVEGGGELGRQLHAALGQLLRVLLLVLVLVLVLVVLVFIHLVLTARLRRRRCRRLRRRLRRLRRLRRHLRGRSPRPLVQRLQRQRVVRLGLGEGGHSAGEVASLLLQPAEGRVALGEDDGVDVGLLRLQLQLPRQQQARLVHPPQKPQHVHERRDHLDRVLVRRAKLGLVDAQAVAQQRLGLVKLALRLQQRRQVRDARTGVHVRLAEQVDVQRERAARLCLGKRSLAHILQRDRELVVAVGDLLGGLAVHGTLQVERAAQRRHHLRLARLAAVRQRAREHVVACKHVKGRLAVRGRLQGQGAAQQRHGLGGPPHLGEDGRQLDEHVGQLGLRTLELLLLVLPFGPTELILRGAQPVGRVIVLVAVAERDDQRGALLDQLL